MMKRFNQTGSHLVVVALIVVVVGVLGFAAYTVANHNKRSATETADGTALTTPKTIQNTEDLQTTADSLESSSSDLDASVDASSLDSDMNELL